MGLWQRFIRVIKSYLNFGISKLEDPELIIEQAIRDLHEQIQEATQKVGSTIAYEKKLKKMMDEELAQSKLWEQRAMKAVEKGRDDLAKEALARKAEHDKMAEEYRRQWEQQKAEVEKLKKGLQMMREKLEEARRKKTLLIAKKQQAEAKKLIHETMSTMTDNSAMAAIDNMMQKIDELEAQAEAQAEINLTLEDASLESKFKQLEITDDSQEEALLALKAKMGLLPSQQKEVKSDQKVRETPQEELLEEELEKIKEKVSYQKQ